MIHPIIISSRGEISKDFRSFQDYKNLNLYFVFNHIFNHDIICINSKNRFFKKNNFFFPQFEMYSSPWIKIK